MPLGQWMEMRGLMSWGARSSVKIGLRESGAVAAWWLGCAWHFSLAQRARLLVHACLRSSAGLLAPARQP